MSYATLSGMTSHVSRGSESTEFRVGRQSVWIGAAPHLGDGDLVSVVGHEKNGIVHALVMRNDTTGVVSHRRLPSGVIEASPPMFIFGAFALVTLLLFGGAGLIFLPFVFPSAGFLLFVRHKRNEVDRATEVLSQIPVSHPSS
jgi:hypothetical protein